VQSSTAKSTEPGATVAEHQAWNAVSECKPSLQKWCKVSLQSTIMGRKMHMGVFHLCWGSAFGNDFAKTRTFLHCPHPPGSANLRSNPVACSCSFGRAVHDSTCARLTVGSLLGPHSGSSDVILKPATLHCRDVVEGAGLGIRVEPLRPVVCRAVRDCEFRSGRLVWGKERARQHTFPTLARSVCHERDRK